MATITRLITPAGGTGRFDPAASIIKASQSAEKWGFTCLIYGRPGVGKTTLASTAQDCALGRDVIIVAPEKGTRSIRNRDDVDVLPVSTWEQFEDSIRWLCSAEAADRYRTIVVDSLTEAQDLCMASILATNRLMKPRLQDFGDLAVLMSAGVRVLKESAEATGRTVLFLAVSKDFTDKATGLDRVGPDLAPKVYSGLGRLVDAVGYMEISGKKRVLHFEHSSMREAKVRQPLTSATAQLPLKIEDPDMSKILNALNDSAG